MKKVKVFIAVLLAALCVTACGSFSNMSEQDAYSRQLGLENASTFCGVTVLQKKNEKKKI